MKATLHTDGGSRGNPGQAGIGYVLVIADNEPVEYGEHIGETTNNVAEYTALREGMKRAAAEDVTKLDCFLDSELVVKQLAKEYRVKDANLRLLYDEVCELMSSFERVTFTHVRRAQNKEADRLVNEALDAA